MNNINEDESRAVCAEYKRRTDAGEKLTPDEVYDWTAHDKLISHEIPALAVTGTYNVPKQTGQPRGRNHILAPMITPVFTPAAGPSVQQAKLDTLSTILIQSANSTLPPEEHAANIHRAFAALDTGKLLTKDNAKELAGAVADVAETYHKTGDLRAAILGAVFHFFGHK